MAPPFYHDVGEVIVTSKTGGQKGQKAEAYSLIPVWPLAEVARVYGFGAKKYSPWNWLKGYDWSLTIDALGRHIEAFKSRQSLDPESGLHHLAHAAFHLFALMAYERLGLGTDDRAPKTAQQTIEQPEQSSQDQNPS